MSLVSCYNGELINCIGSGSALALEREAPPSHMLTYMAQLLTLQ